jgi:dephospho-CoA kinase
VPGVKARGRGAGAPGGQRTGAARSTWFTNRVLLIGLTGGIGAGKSVVADRLAALGAVVVDADVVARQVVAPGTDGLREVAAAFGRGVLYADGTLDRTALAGRVFGDEPARRRLERIIHPLVRARTAELIAAAPPDAVVVNDVPLLVEVGLAATYHLVLVVEAAEATRVARLVADRGMAEAEAYARIHAQTGDELRRAAADVVLDNGGALDDLYARVDRLWSHRLLPYEENVRLRREAKRPERLDIVPYDPTWPDQYARLAARVSHAAAGRRTDHVGPTAVPGLPAKDVIDIQLTVDSLADADRIADALADAGFPRANGEWSDFPKPEAPDPAAWRRRLHGGADPGRVVRLHVRAAGSPGWRAALLFRDWLRADPRARAECVAEKERLAAGGPTATGYATAEEPWFDEMWPRARGWAESTGWGPGPPT